MYDEIIEYWKAKINALLTYKGVSTANLINTDWENELDDERNWRDINRYAVSVCEDIYNKATANVNAPPMDFSALDVDFPVDLVRDNPVIDTPQPFVVIFWDKFFQWENSSKFADLLIDVLDYTPTVDDRDEDDPWQDLKTLLGGLTLEQLIEDVDDFTLKIGNLLGTTPFLPADWETKLVSKTDLDTANAEIAALNTNITNLNHDKTTLTIEKAGLTTERDNYKLKADEYDRIYAKLSGKVSDAELDALLNPSPPPCSHTDYDAIKNERNTLKTETNTLRQNQDEIIAGLELGQNSTLDQILAKIKQLSAEVEEPTYSVKKDLLARIEKLSFSGDLTAKFKNEVESATSYRQLSEIQAEHFKKGLEGKNDTLKRFEDNNGKLKAGLVVSILLALSAIVLAVIIYLRKQKQVKKVGLN